MNRDIKIIKEAAKKPSKKKEKPEDPNEVARKLRGLPKHHQVGRIVHAALAVPGGAGYRGEVVKVDNDHTYVKVGKNRIVKAPHRLVSAHEEVVHEETKEEKKDRLKREAEIALRQANKYKEMEDKIEGRDERSKRRHERARKLHQEEVKPTKKELEAHHKKQQIQRKIIDEAKMKLFDVSEDLVNAVKQVMEKKMSKDEIAALSGDKKKVEPEDFEAMGRGEHKKPKHKKKHHVKEEEILDERNKENKFKKDLHVAKKGVEHATKNWGFSPEDHVSMSRAFGHDKPTERDNMKSLLKDYKRRGRAVTKEELEVEEAVSSSKEEALKHATAMRKKNGDKLNAKELYDRLKKAPKATPMGDGKSGFSPKNEEVEHVDEARDPGSTVGSTPLRKRGQYVSDDGRHVAKIKRDVDWNEYRVEIHSDGKHNKKADYHTDDKEDAHDSAKAMLAHAVKHAKPLKEAVMVAGGGDESKRKEVNTKNTKKTFPNVKHLTHDGHPDWKKHGVKEETSLVSKIINKYSK